MPRLLALCAVLAALLVCARLAAPQFARWESRQHETSRLHTHFTAVLDELVRRDVASLDESRQASRARLIDLLRQYDRAGRFPRNEGQCARRNPIFVDRHGTRCAMAYLIEHAGGGALVARVAATANLARIHDLAGDPELTGWLAASGLSLDEAARIQPEYDPPGGQPSSGDASREDHMPEDDSMNAGLVFSLGLGLPALTMSLSSNSTRAERRRAAALSLVVATGSLTMGTIDAAHDRHLRASGLAQLLLGATYLTLGLLDLHDAHEQQAFATTRPPDRAQASWLLRPGQEGEPQLAVSVAF